MKDAVVIKKIKIISLIVILVLLTNCNDKKQISNNISLNKGVKYVDTISDGLTLIQSKCYSCHSISSNSHDEIIAPPLAAVKQRYLRSFSEKEDFVKAISEWVQEPKAENALMRGAVNKFKVMPYLSISETEAITIANFIYYNELDKPSWFQQHFNKEHQSGKGRGNGFKSGKGQGRFKNRF